MRILLAGATGVLGRRTVPRLIEAGHEVAAVSRRAETDRGLGQAGAEPLRLDLFDAAAAGAAAEGADAVVNLATAIPSPPGSLRRGAWRQNDRLRRDASRVLAEAAIRAGARFVQESFAPTYPDRGAEWITEDLPLEPAHQAETVADAEASAARVTASGGVGIALRFGLFYGRETPEWLERAAKGRLMLPGPADRFTSMVHIGDAAAAVVAALGAPAGVYNVVDDEPLTREAHAQVLADLVGQDHVRPLPGAIGGLAMLRVLARSHRVSNARLRESTDWRPACPSVREGWPLVVEGADGA